MSNGLSPDHQRFLADILANGFNGAALDAWDALQLKGLFQTVCNLQAGRVPEEGIKDYDIFYFDPDDLSAAGEAGVQKQVGRR